MFERKCFLVALGSLALVAGSAQAALIASESFTYSDGALAGNNGGTGWGGAWGDVGGSTAATVAGGAGQTSMTAAGGFAQSEAQRDLSGVIDITGGVWIRATIQKTSTVGVSDSFGGINLYNGATDLGLTGNFWPGVAVDAWGTGPNFGQGEIAGELVTTLSDVVIYLDDTQTLLWINEDPLALGAAEAAGSAHGDFNRIRLRNGTATDGTETWQFDDILIGDTAADVGVVVPEPGSLALLGLSGLLIARRRRA